MVTAKMKTSLSTNMELNHCTGTDMNLLTLLALFWNNLERLQERNIIALVINSTNE